MRRKIKPDRKLKWILGIFILCAILVIAFLIYEDQKGQETYRIPETGTGESEQIYSITYKGRDYEYNNSIDTVLLIGADSTGEMKPADSYGVDARADNIDLIIMDKRNGIVKILPISRDTMTEITRYSAQGYETGSHVDHLGYAFSYGDGAEASCSNVCDAVSELLYNVDVRNYIGTNLDSIAFANDLVGGVTVTVPNSDLEWKYPEMKKGASVTLTDENVSDFLRYRDTDVDGSNNGRMQRQQAFLDGFIEKVKTMDEAAFTDMWKKLKSDDSNILTNMNKAQFIKLMSRIDDYRYDSSDSNLKIEGTDSVEDGHDVFYPDEKKLKQLVVDTFYTEQ